MEQRKELRLQTNQQVRAGKHRPKIGLALGGGAARGIAHIGVLKVLHEAGISIDFLAGSSVGSLIAGAYASGLAPPQLTTLAQQVRWSDLGRVTISTLGLQTNQKLEEYLRQHLPVDDFSRLAIPLSVVATDLVRGTRVILQSGSVARAVRASCTIPGIYVPVPDEAGRLLIDGGFVNNLPAAIVREMGADYVIAVSLNSHMRMDSVPTNVVQVLLQSVMLAARASEARLCNDADLVVRPVIEDIRWDDFSRVTDLIQLGEDAMRTALPQVQTMLAESRPGIWQRLKRTLWRPATEELLAK